MEFRPIGLGTALLMRLWWVRFPQASPINPRLAEPGFVRLLRCDIVCLGTIFGENGHTELVK